MIIQYRCMPYCIISDMRKIEHPPLTKIFDTLEQSIKYQKKCLKKGYKSYIEKVTPYYPYANAKEEKYRQTIEYKIVK